MDKLSEFEKKLLNLLQENLPLCARPYAALAERLGVSEKIVLEKIVELKERGFIRRIGTFFDSERLGFSGTLIALSVDKDKVADVAEFINRYPGVTHNYERADEFNLWFTLLTESVADEQKILAEVKALPGVRRTMNLPSTKKYKINVTFKV